jgi:hypothetical protein
MVALTGAIRLGLWPAPDSTQAADLMYRAADYQESLFDRRSLLGWFPPAEGGNWSIQEDDEKVPVLTGAGYVRRTFANLENYQLTLGLDIFKAEAAELIFAIPERPSPAAARLVLRITKKDGAILGSKSSSKSAFKPLSGAVAFPSAEEFGDGRPYLEVRIVRIGAYWSAVFNGKQVGRVQNDNVRRLPEFQIWSGPGQARVDSVVFEKIELIGL